MVRIGRAWHALRTYAALVRFEHTIFALPFAIIGAVLAGRSLGLPHGIPSLRALGWILIAMVSARTAAMAFNRIVDADYDARNPRTWKREIPTGAVKKWQAGVLTVIAAVLLLIAAGNLNQLCLRLAPLALVAVTGYSYTKRVTQWTHLALGGAIGIAPVGAWLGVTGSFGWIPILLWAAVALWIGGFDIIYALQDIEVDRQLGLFSLPARMGPAPALRVARILHAVMLALLGSVGVMASLGAWYYAGLLLCAVFLGYEHSIVRPDDFSRVDTAFFTVNGWVSVILCGTTILDVW